MQPANLTQIVLAHGREHPDRPCLRFFRADRWQELRWGAFTSRVRAVAGGLAALGVETGDRVAIVSANRPEWALADIGAIACGAVVTTIYPTLTANDTAFILAHSGSRVAFVEDREQLDKVRAVRDRLPRLERLVLLDPEARREADAHTLADLEAIAGEAAVEAAVARGLAADRSARLTVVYTSGTTGTPKGAILTHGNVLAIIEAVLAALGDHSRLQLNLSFLPLAHALERIAGHFMPLYLGRTIAYARSLDTVAADFVTIRPNYAVAVPRVFEKVSARILGEVARKPAPVRALFGWAIRAGTRRSELIERGAAVPLGLRWRHAVGDALVGRKVRARFGGRVELFVSGGAPLAAEIARLFHAVGILICEGWGATETAAPSTWNSPLAYRLGSVGRPLPGVEVRLAADSELEVRGPNVFPGYLDAEADTAEAFTADGFWRSGDIGSRDDDGYYYVTDRKKELVILASGKNIAPQKIENALRRRPLVSNCMVVGDRRAFLVALLTVDRAAVADGHPELADVPVGDPRLHALLAGEVEAVNADLARFEQVKRFVAVEPDFSPEGGELTLTLKLKRRVIASRHRAALDGLYETGETDAR